MNKCLRDKICYRFLCGVLPLVSIRRDHRNRDVPQRRPSFTSRGYRQKAASEGVAVGDRPRAEGRGRRATGCLAWRRSKGAEGRRAPVGVPCRRPPKVVAWSFLRAGRDRGRRCHHALLLRAGRREAGVHPEQGNPTIREGAMAAGRLAPRPKAMIAMSPSSSVEARMRARLEVLGMDFRCINRGRQRHLLLSFLLVLFYSDVFGA